MWRSWVCLHPLQTTFSESQSLQIQSHSLWINYENNNFPAIDVLPCPPYSSVCPPTTRLLHPRPSAFFFVAFIACRQQITWECPSGHLGREVWIYLNNYCSLAPRRVGNAFTALFLILFLFVSRLFIVFLAILPCPGARLKWHHPPPPKWQPYTKAAYHQCACPG